MKSNIYILFAIIGVIITSCSSPESKGKKIGIDYCKCLNSKKTDKLNSIQIERLKDSCFKTNETKYNVIIESFKTNNEKLNLFKHSYNSIIDTAIRKIDSVYTLAIKKQLSKSLWIKKGEDDYKNYLYSFSHDTMKIINRKGNYLYHLESNKLVFKDKGNNSQGIIKFLNLDSFYLANADTSKNRIFYVKANAYDSLVGLYFGKEDYAYYKTQIYNYKLTFKPNKVVFDNNANQLYSYELKKNTVLFNYPNTEKVKFKMDIIHLKNLKGYYVVLLKLSMYRLKSDELNNLDMLFKN